MQFEFRQMPNAYSGDLLALADRQIPIVFVRNPRARRYVLRLRPDGSARVTIPRGGSLLEARRFAARNVTWIERELAQLAARPTRLWQWAIGTQIHLRGELVELESVPDGMTSHIRFGTEIIELKGPVDNLRGAVERHLWGLAAKELPPKVFEQARLLQLTVQRVTVRNQKSRWGSCSRRGTISLNWRLIQTPGFVQEYLILHELMHLKQMNHSHRFWSEVASVCPDYEAAERWLKQHSALLR